MENARCSRDTSPCNEASNHWWAFVLSLNLHKGSHFHLWVHPSWRCLTRIHYWIWGPIRGRSCSSSDPLNCIPCFSPTPYEQGQQTCKFLKTSFWPVLYLYLWMASIPQVSFWKLPSIMKHSMNWHRDGYGRMRQVNFSTCWPVKVSWGPTDCCQTECWKTKNTNRPSKF